MAARLVHLSWQEVADIVAEKLGIPGLVSAAPTFNIDSVRHEAPNGSAMPGMVFFLSGITFTIADPPLPPNVEEQVRRLVDE